ncbi:MAG: Beta-glucuronidase [Chitinophagaceae bacterium]|nr:Beta-glucuronidase [Chitinophagaceae bacterium]
MLLKPVKTCMKQILPFLFTCLLLQLKAQTNLITNIGARKITSLNGKWQYIIDPYETGFYDYRYQERQEKDRDAYWNTDIPQNKTDKKEHGYNNKYILTVPGDWNSQDSKFIYYEGTVWYKKSFDFVKSKSSDRVFIYFGAVNYRADVYLNGKKLGMHKGGFTPFNFEIPDSVLKAKDNFLVVKVDNKRSKDEVPTVNTDWWNYGGITRDVLLAEVPQNFIKDYFIQLKKSSPLNNPEAEGWVKLNNAQSGSVEIDIPELKIKKIFPVTDSIVNISFNVTNAQLWSPENPKLYQVKLTTASETITDKIGFRTIEAAGKQVLLNGKPIFMRGISIHEEIPMDVRRAYSRQDALWILGKAKSLNCNMVRLAHYPHDETMTRLADSLGILVWSEIPVYWTIDFTSKAVFEKARTQLSEMITRDHNRASVIIWSVGNETPVNETRTAFMHNLISAARELDATRLISAALETNYSELEKTHLINDPLGKYVDLVSFNEYLGWYGGLPSNATNATWKTIYDKPLFISETGAEALSGFHADSLTRWSEEYQAWYYREQVAMFKKMPENFVGISPWILLDFRSPRRNNPVYQQGWNNKGLLDHQGKPKKAFNILKKYYADKKMNEK